MNIEKLKRLAEAAAPGPWTTGFFGAYCIMGIGSDMQKKDAVYIAAANPDTILELIRQRDELLAALKDAREMVSDWGAYATAYMQEKHDLAGDLERLDAAISKVEEQS